ncbi:MAG: tetratricopeptide repeat protein [Calditrichaeota bacterium]|nr:tetratricopeptide repeat protein [Calditrichota bacterium]
MHCLQEFHRLNRAFRCYFSRGVLFSIFIFSSVNGANDKITPSAASPIGITYVKQLKRELKVTEVAILYAEDAIRSVSDSTYLAEMLFHLSELEVRRERLRFEFEMIKYDHRQQLFESRKVKTEPEPPTLSFARAIGINEQILESFPNVPFKQKVLYRNSICYYETGQKDKAKEIFLKLIPQVKSDTVRAELTFRLGECYFDKQDYKKALISYNHILKSWDSPFFAMALYKIGWCHYLTNRIPDAISTFYYLLKDIRLLETMDSEILGKSQLELRDEVLQYIALSFSEFGGTQLLLDFIDKNGTTDYKPHLLYKLGKIFFKRDFYKDALEALNYVKQNFATFEQLPEVYKLIFENYNRLEQSKKAIAARDEFMRACGDASQWSMAHPYSEFRTAYDSTLAEMDYRIASPILQSADSLFALEKFELAMPVYQQFLSVFSKDKRCDHAQFCVAECFFNLRQFAEAEKEYQKLIDKFPNSELFEDAAYNRVICFDEMTAADTPEKSKGLPFPLITACEQFLESVPTSDRTVEIELKLAEIYYQYEVWQESEKWTRSALMSILKTKIGTPYKLNAMNMLAQIKFKRKNYATAAAIFTRLKKEKPDSAQLLQMCDKMIASAQYKIGEKLKSGGWVEKAAQSFELTAIRSADKEIARAAQFEAAVQYEKIGKNLKAAVNFESFYRRFPDHRQATEALYRAASLREKLQQYHLAATDYRRLFRILGNSDKGAAALFNAGLALENAGDWLAMRQIFRDYSLQFPQDENRVLEAMFKMAYASEKQRLAGSARQDYLKVLDKHRQLSAAGLKVNDDFAAEAAFRLAEMDHEYFRGLKLVPPFQFHLKQKQAAFSAMLKKYVNVTRYDMAEWTTASFYQIGLAYEEFCQDILNSPEPGGLTAKQKQAYWTTIENQLVIPLQLEAFKYYQANLNIAMQHSIQNTWTERTREQLMLLRQTLAGKNALPTDEQIKRAGTDVPRRQRKSRRTL